VTTNENLVKLSDNEETLNDGQRHLSIVNSLAVESDSSKVISQLRRDNTKVGGRTIMSQLELNKVYKVDNSTFMSQPKSNDLNVIDGIDGVTRMSQSKVKEIERKEKGKKSEIKTPKSAKKTPKRLVKSKSKIPVKEQCELQRMFERIKRKKVEIEPLMQERKKKENVTKEEIVTPKMEINVYRKEKESLEKKRRVKSIKEMFEAKKKKEERKESDVQSDFIRSEGLKEKKVVESFYQNLA